MHQARYAIPGFAFADPYTQLMPVFRRCHWPIMAKFSANSDRNSLL